MTEPVTLSAPVFDGERGPFAKAFVAAQKATESVKKAASNPAFKSKYADLSHVVEGVIPALNENGIGVIQSPSYDGDLMGLTTILIHESGATCTATLHMRPSKTDPQGVGSAITYARRYALLAMTGAAPEDDDGNAASGPRTTPEPTKREDPETTAAVLASKAGIDLAKDDDALAAWGQANGEMIRSLPPEQAAAIRRHYAKRQDALRQKEAA